MRRTFTFLLVLFFAVTLSAQEAALVEEVINESPASKFKKEFLNRLGEPLQPGVPLQIGKPGQPALPGSDQRLAEELDVKSGRPPARLKQAAAARLNPAAAKQRLDSIVGQKVKTIYDWNEDGKVTSTVEYVRDTVTDPWTPNLKDETSFDESGRTAENAEYHWEDSLKQWVGDWKYAYTRDGEGRTILWQAYEWDTESGQWVLDIEWEYGYDGDGNQNTFTIYNWDAQLGERVGVYTEEYVYDANGNSTSSTSSRLWDPVAKQFKPEWAMEITRDANGMITTWVETRWDEAAGKWVNTQKGDNTIDENGNVTSNLWSDWDTVSNEWIPTTESAFTFDADNNNTSNTVRYWNADSNRWENGQKWEYIYEATKSASSSLSVNAEGRLIATVYYLWYPVPIPGMWMPLYRTDLTYDENGNLTQSLESHWDPIGQEWVEASKEESTFNEMGYRTLRVTYMWDTDSSKWIAQSRYEDSYDANGFRTHSASYGWDYLNNRLIGWNRTDYVRDEYVNSLSITYFVWNLILNDWVGLSRYVYTYDYAFGYADLLLPFYIQYKILQYIAYAFIGDVPLKSDDEDWEQNDIFIYYYSELEVGTDVHEIIGGELSVFPNPASDYIEIQGDLGTGAARILMYDVSGSLVMDRVLESGGRIPVGHLSEGIYVVRLLHGNKVKTGKVMIE